MSDHLGLNILGAGKVALSLAWHWQRLGQFQIQGVCNRSLASAQAAVAQIGRGQALGDPTQLPNAKALLIGVPDDQIAPLAERLAEAGQIQAGTLVFHCSGALSSEALRPCQDQGAWVASLHPVRSFPAPILGAAALKDTHCGLEGDAQALTILEPAVRAFGGIPFRIAAEHKALYHAAAAMACNYLVTLQEGALRLYAQAGIEADTALALLAPLLRGTVDNLLRVGPAQALTGPIARGDAETVARHLRALEKDAADLAPLYRQLGALTLELAEQHRPLSGAQSERLRQLLS